MGVWRVLIGLGVVGFGVVLVGGTWWFVLGYLVVWLGFGRWLLVGWLVNSRRFGFGWVWLFVAFVWVFWCWLL